MTKLIDLTGSFDAVEAPPEDALVKKILALNRNFEFNGSLSLSDYIIEMRQI